MSREIERFVALPDFSHVENVQRSGFLTAHVLNFEVNRPVSELGIKQIAAGLELRVRKGDNGLGVEAKGGSTWKISCTDLHTKRPKFELLAEFIIPQEQLRVTDFIRHLGHPDSERPVKTELHRLAAELLVKDHVYGKSDSNQKDLEQGKLHLSITSGRTHTDIGATAAHLDLFVEKKKPRKAMFVDYVTALKDADGKHFGGVSHYGHQVNETELARLVLEEEASIMDKRLGRVRDLVISPSKEKPRWTLHIKDVPDKLNHVRQLDLTVTGKDLTPKDTAKISSLVNELQHLNYPPVGKVGETIVRGIAALRRLRKLRDKK